MKCQGLQRRAVTTEVSNKSRGTSVVFTRALNPIPEVQAFDEMGMIARKSFAVAQAVVGKDVLSVKHRERFFVELSAGS